MNHNYIVYFVHVGFVHIFITQFLTDGLISVLLFKLGHFYVSFGTLSARFCHDGCHLLDGGGLRCFGHDGWMTAIYVLCTHILFQFLHYTDKIV